jgi:hypothetical protein
MQYVNDDMDELFKRAAENYPLDTNSANWNKVLAALQNETEVKTLPENKGNKSRRLLWLLLLLPLGLICNQLYSPNTVNNKGGTTGGVQDETLRSVDKTDQQTNSPERLNSNNVTSNSIVTTNSDKKNTNGNLKNKPVSSPAISPLEIQKKSSQPITGSSKNYNKAKAHSATDVFTSGNFKKQDNVSDDFKDEMNENYRKYFSEIPFSKALVDLRPNMFNRKLDPLITSSDVDSKQPVRVARRKKFYGGIMGGVDMTTIKFQKVENAGKTFGILLGYQLNKKWSIESGVYIEEKYYYTEGKYFDAKKIYPGMPPNYWVDNVYGNCKMIEVPFSLRYNFISHKNSGLFATTGISSYFMKKESYIYDYYYGSTSSYRRHELDTANATRNLFSNLSLSIGYNHRLGNFADVRVEPYLKVPVSKMGIGNLPLFSTGLQVGLTRKF